MTEYRRSTVPEGSYFFTVNCAQRQNNRILTDHIATLRDSFRLVKQARPFAIDAIVILPDHLHCIWTLPEGDSDYKTRWSLIKANFSRQLPKTERRSVSRVKRRERGIWQRRYWEHTLTDEEDFARHVDYIHANPLKHGYVKQVRDWPYSSFHKFVERGIYTLDWAGSVDEPIQMGE